MLFKNLFGVKAKSAPNEYFAKEGHFWEFALEKISGTIDQNEELSKEIFKAKKEYFTTVGPIHDNDGNFSNRMNSFLFWFLFDWSYGREPITPFQRYLTLLNDEEDEIWADILANMHRQIHSLFELKKLKDGVTIVKDLFTDVSYQVPGFSIFSASDLGIYFESRLFFYGDYPYFANYFIQHPHEVRKKIKKQIKLLKARPTLWKKLILKLHSFHTKWNKYRNIKIQYIYHFDKSDPEAK